MGYMERKSVDADAPVKSADLEKMQADVKSALYELTNTVKADNTETKNKLLDFVTKYNDHAEKYAEDKRAYDKAIKDAEKKAADAEARVKDLEVKVATGGTGGKVDYWDEPDTKSYYGMLKARPETKELAEFGGSLKRKELELKDAGLIRTDNMSQGGYLVPPTTANRVIEKMIEISPTRALAGSMPMPSKTMSIPTEKAIPDSYYEGEAEAALQGTLTIGEETLQAWRHALYLTMTYDQLMMSPFDMEARIHATIGKSFAKKESWMHIKGSGNKQPQGWTKHADAASHTITSAAAQTITIRDLATLAGQLKAGYNGMFLWGRLSFAQIVQISDTLGRPIINPVAGDAPPNIWGYPYSSKFIDMDQLAYNDGTKNGTSNTIPIAFADLEAGYTISDVMGMRVIRDDITYATQNIIKYTFSRYHTARVTQPEAIKLLKVQ